MTYAKRGKSSTFGLVCEQINCLIEIHASFANSRFSFQSLPSSLQTLIKFMKKECAGADAFVLSGSTSALVSQQEARLTHRRPINPSAPSPPPIRTETD